MFLLLTKLISKSYMHKRMRGWLHDFNKKNIQSGNCTFMRMSFGTLSDPKYFFVIIILTASFNFTFAQVYPDKKVDSLLREGIKLIVNQKYDEAEVFFNSMNKNYPEIPLAKIYLAANKIAEAYDYAEEFDENFILNNLNEAKEQSEELIEQNTENIWCHYFYALAEGYISYYNAINENWFSALSSGVNSIAEFEKILSADNKFYEAYIAIGTFEYWKSRKMEFMDWLPFNNDTKKIGIDKLIVAIDSSSYNSYLAINSLIWIYIDQKRFADAIKISGRALKDFPDSRSFKWGKARAYEEIDPIKAIELYDDILRSYPETIKSNYNNEIVLKHLIAQQYVKLGKTEEAIKYCDEILSMRNLPANIRNELSERIERVRNLSKDLMKKR